MSTTKTISLTKAENAFAIAVTKLSNEAGIKPERAVRVFGLLANLAVQQDVDKRAAPLNDAFDFYMQAFAEGMGVQIAGVEDLTRSGPLQ
jgi:hypothetical protein